MELLLESAGRAERFPIQDIDCISAAILIVAKLENVSDTAYGKMI
jgi:hypothetical protein